jgi:YbgC/YbaW family acyl-CoA thioester hydrolase
MSHASIPPFAVRVYCEDTGFSGHVHHASYLRFLERGRTELLYRKNRGVILVVQSLQIG